MLGALSDNTKTMRTTSLIDFVDMLVLRDDIFGNYLKLLCFTVFDFTDFNNMIFSILDYGLTTKNEFCLDEDSPENCELFKSEGLCHKYENLMRVKCAKTCKLCGKLNNKRATFLNLQLIKFRKMMSERGSSSEVSCEKSLLEKLWKASTMKLRWNRMKLDCNCFLAILLNTCEQLLLNHRFEVNTEGAKLRCFKGLEI